MELNQKYYRTNYTGENINTFNSDGQPVSYFVAPRENVFKTPFTDTAIILGNGQTRNYPAIQHLLKVNTRKVAESYKLVYACNLAIEDQDEYDYYIIKNRAFLANVPEHRKNQIYLPYDIFLDYQNESNLLPYISYFNAGAQAAYLACFDGHKKIFLFGFDGDYGNGFKTVYDNQSIYGDGTTSVHYGDWADYLYRVMQIYRDVQFYRIQADAEAPPISWQSLPNFKNVGIREAVLTGDF